MAKLNLAFILLIFFTAQSHSATRHQLVLATDHVAPYSYLEEGTVKGLNVEFARRLIKDLPIDLEVLFCPWARCLKMVADNQAQMLIGLSKTSDREKDYHFLTKPFFRSHQPFHFYYIDDKNAITNESDLSNRIIGKLRGSAHYPDFDQDHSLITVEGLNVPSLIQMLKRGRIDVFIHLGGTIEPYLTKFDHNREIKRSPFIKSTYQEGYVVFSKAWRDKPLLAQIDAQMAQLFESNYVDDLFKTYKIEK